MYDVSQTKANAMGNKSGQRRLELEVPSLAGSLKTRYVLELEVGYCNVDEFVLRSSFQQMNFGGSLNTVMF